MQRRGTVNEVCSGVPTTDNKKKYVGVPFAFFARASLHVPSHRSATTTTGYMSILFRMSSFPNK